MYLPLSIYSLSFSPCASSICFCIQLWDPSNCPPLTAWTTLWPIERISEKFKVSTSWPSINRSYRLRNSFVFLLSQSNTLSLNIAKFLLNLERTSPNFISNCKGLYWKGTIKVQAVGKTVVEFDRESRRQLTRTIYIQRVGDSE